MAGSQAGATLFSGWGETLAAVVTGNVLYFLARPLLPAAMQHELFHLDPGLFIDFLFCVAVLIAIRRLKRQPKR